MLTKAQLDGLWSIEVACQRSIRAAKYFDAVQDAENTVWSFTQNCYGAVCIIHWCQIFGSQREPTHYSKLFADGMVAQMTREIVKERLRTSIGMNKSQYCSFWKSVTDARNKFFVHYEFGAKDRPIFPDIDQLLKTCLEMRDIVREILDQESSQEQNQLDEFRRLTSHDSNASYLSEILGDVGILAHAVTSRNR